MTLIQCHPCFTAEEAELTCSQPQGKEDRDQLPDPTASLRRTGPRSSWAERRKKDRWLRAGIVASKPRMRALETSKNGSLFLLSLVR